MKILKTKKKNVYAYEIDDSELTKKAIMFELNKIVVESIKIKYNKTFSDFLNDSIPMYSEEDFYLKKLFNAKNQYYKAAYQERLDATGYNPLSRINCRCQILWTDKK